MIHRKADTYQYLIINKYRMFSIDKVAVRLTFLGSFSDYMPNNDIMCNTTKTVVFLSKKEVGRGGGKKSRVRC